MPVTRPDELRCPSCGKWHAVATLFDQAIGANPVDHQLTFKCGRCRVSSLLQLCLKTLTIGNFDGAPGPSFIPEGRIRLDYTRRFSRKNGATIEYQGREWRIPSHKFFSLSSIGTATARTHGRHGR